MSSVAIPQTIPESTGIETMAQQVIFQFSYLRPRRTPPSIPTATGAIAPQSNPDPPIPPPSAKYALPLPP